VERPQGLIALAVIVVLIVVTMVAWPFSTPSGERRAVPSLQPRMRPLVPL
jgi:hypothetical protein